VKSNKAKELINEYKKATYISVNKLLGKFEKKLNVDVTDKFQRHPMKQTAQSSTNVGSWCFQISHALQKSLKI